MIRNVHFIHGFKFVEPDAALSAFTAFVRGSSNYANARRGHTGPREFRLVDPRPLFGQPVDD